VTSSTSTWYVWLTAGQTDYAEGLCAKLIRRGWTVGPLGRQLITQFDDCPACVVALSIRRDPRNEEEKKEYTALGVHAELCDVMRHIKGKFWSLVVSEAALCTWSIGNARLSKEEKEKAEAAKKVN
jgi:hypothetical protein